MDIECPYCEEGLDICHDDGFGYEEGVKHQYECQHCGKRFIFETSISFYYDAERADCLNGGDHSYELSRRYPIEFSKMKCSTCSDERELTDEERLNLNIGTKQSYVASLR